MLAPTPTRRRTGGTALAWLSAARPASVGPVGTSAGRSPGADRREYPVGGHGQRADACPGGGEDGISDRGWDDPDGWLAGAPGDLFGPVDEDDVDGGHFVKPHHRVRRRRMERVLLPIEARHAAFVELHLLFQRAADALDDVALDLVAQAVGVDDQSAV